MSRRKKFGIFLGVAALFGVVSYVVRKKRKKIESPADI